MQQLPVAGSQQLKKHPTDYKIFRIYDKNDETFKTSDW